MYIISPVPGSEVKGIVNVQVYAPGIQKVSFYVDGVLKGNDLSAPFSFAWHTTNYPDGSHEIKVVSGNGKTNTKALFTVKNAVPTQAPESPGKTIVQGTTGQIVDSDGHVWTIGADSKIYVDNIVDAPTSAVVQLVYTNHIVYQLNTSGNWYWKTHVTDAWQGPSTLSPLPPVRNCSITLGGKMVEKQTLTAGISCQ